MKFNSFFVRRMIPYVRDVIPEATLVKFSFRQQTVLIWVNVLLLMTLALPARAQSPAASTQSPDPQPPTLEVTLRFIVDKMGGFGLIKAKSEPTLLGTTTHSFLYSNLKADVDRCTVSYDYEDEWSITRKGDDDIPPERSKTREQISVANIKSFEVQPPKGINLTILILRTSAAPVLIEVSDTQIAQRLGKAFVYAAPLCAPQAKEPF